eukprot:TRINITY_DN2835_c0_g1_i4.p1 TRINITY_DN2835_c0_g1~~TRINITY_DN2835_c0_g1_i4.p1  ORF type:complete len:621 (-),score=148.72 TRINITY_DN2835_c0_g1_i4:324-2186(-)
MALLHVGANAVHRFKEKKYESALESLRKIQHQKEDDLKVEHNIAIGEYFQSGCAQSRRILGALAKIKYRIEESQHRTGSETPYAEENDTSLLLYNEAVLYFHLKQHATSTAILELLFSNIEPIEEGLAVKISFLLLDNYWVLRRTTRATGAIAFLDRILELAAGVEMWTPNAEGKPCVCPEAINMKQFGLKLHMHKAQFHVLNQSFRSSKKEIKQALSMYPRSVGPVFLKANFEFLRRNYRKSLKLLHSVSNQSEQQKLSPAINNNVACIHFSLNNYNAALWYLSRALKATDALAHQQTLGAARIEQGDVPAMMFAQCQKSEMLYNSGLQLLLTSKPKEAFNCFQEASVILFHCPQLWLRLAECCLAHFGRGSKEQAAQGGNPLVVSTIDIGQSHKIVLPVLPVCATPPRVSAADNDDNPIGNTSSVAPVEVRLSVEYAMYCARNAYSLARPERGPESAHDQSGASAPVVAKYSQGADGESDKPDSTAELVLVRVHALVVLSYAALCSQSAELALGYAQELLVETENSTDCGELRLLAYMYAAEALVLMNRVTDAATLLQPAAVGELLDIPAAPPTLRVLVNNDGGSDDEGGVAWGVAEGACSGDSADTTPCASVLLRNR